MSDTKTPFEPRTYQAHWERPEWIYHQVLEVKKVAEQPKMQELRKERRAVYLQKMGQQFQEFFDHYPKIFMRVCEGTLNEQMLLMLLKKRKEIDEGKDGFSRANDEVIGSAFSLLSSKLPQDLKEKVMNTYKDLVEEKNELQKKAIDEYMKEQNISLSDPTQSSVSLSHDTLSAEQNEVIVVDTIDDDDEQTEIERIKKQENEAKEKEQKVQEIMEIVKNAQSKETNIV